MPSRDGMRYSASRLAEIGDGRGDVQIGFLGSGVMAEAIIRGLIAKEVVKPGDVWASDL